MHRNVPDAFKVGDKVFQAEPLSNRLPVTRVPSGDVAESLDAHR
jgi:hypothetical protein